MAEHLHPTFAAWLAAKMHGEVPAAAVEAYRRAGAVAYQDMLEAEQLRTRLAAAGGSIWTASRNQSSQMLCAWNAFALQTLGDELVDGVYRAETHTGFLPPVTAEQAVVFLSQVEQWSARAHRAASDPTYNVAAHIVVPAPLPTWISGQPRPKTHTRAMLAAARAMRARAEAALSDLLRTVQPASKVSAVSLLKGLAAEADSVTSFGESLWSPDATTAVHEQVESSLRRCISNYYLLGQVLAMPQLLYRRKRPVRHLGRPF